MVNGIQGNRPIANINASSVEVQKNTFANKLGLFGYGGKQNVDPGGQLAELYEKFDFKPPPYKKGVTQLCITDADYMPDKAFEEKAFCEV